LRKAAKEDIWLKGEEVTRGWICLIIDSIWESHLDHLMNKMSRAHYAISAIKPHMSQESLKVIYFSYFHSIMSYGIIF
jgi:hypothetical protein